MNKVKAMFFTITIIVTFVIAGCSSTKEKVSANQENETNEIRMAIDTAAGGSLQFRAAEEQGFFNAHEIKPQLTNFAMGIDTVNAVLTKQADTGIAADYVTINSLAKGDMVIISTLTRANEKSASETQLLAREEIKTPNDLKGKKLGVSKGTVYEYVWDQYLKANEISEEDVTYVPYSTPDEAIVGMKKGDIEAVWIGGALTDKFYSINGVHQLDNLLGAGVSIDSYLLADRTFVEENPQAIENALKALQEGIEFVQEQKEQTAQIAFEQLKIPKEDALKDLERTNYVLGFTEEDAKHLEEMKSWLEENGILEESFDLKDKLMLDPLKKAVPSLVTYQ